MTERHRPRPATPRRALLRARGFTLIEMIVAGVIAALVLGAVTFSLSQLGRSRNVAVARLESSMRARAALENVRQDIAGVIRDADLLKARVLLVDGTAPTAFGLVDRDELLLFSNSLRATRDTAFSGEGIEYETHYRVEEDDLGAVLWQRRDFMPDGFPDAGGMAIPLVEGVIALRIEAYDGVAWYEEWDSDLDGLPWALRISVSTLPSGEDLADPDPRSLTTLRTLVPIDRIVPPPQETEEDKLADEEVPEDAAADEGLEGDLEGGDVGGFGGGGRGGRGGGGGRGGRGGDGGGDGGGRGGRGPTLGPGFRASPADANMPTGRGSRTNRLGTQEF
jgi:type II secretion system protein J